MLAIGVIKLAGIEIVWFVLTACMGIIIALFPAEHRTRQVMKIKASAEVLKLESPISWLKTTLLFSCISILSGLLYAVINNIDIGISITSMGNYLLFATLLFFGIALLYLVRITWFVFEPTSRNNILTGKVLLALSKYGPTAIAMIVIAMVQIFNLIFLNELVQTGISQGLRIAGYIYAVTIILSFVGMFPSIWQFLFRLNEKIRRRDAFAFFIFSLPWIYLAIIGLLVSMNFELI